MPAAIKNTIYKDFDIAFRRHPVTGNLAVKKNAESIKQAVKSLILTNKYERPFRPLFGSDIRARLFDLFDPSTESNIKYDVKVAMANYEPRAELLDVGIISDPDSNSIRVNIVFRPINQVNPVMQTITLEAIR